MIILTIIPGLLACISATAALWNLQRAHQARDSDIYREARIMAFRFAIAWILCVIATILTYRLYDRN